MNITKRVCCLLILLLGLCFLAIAASGNFGVLSEDCSDISDWAITDNGDATAVTWYDPATELTRFVLDSGPNSAANNDYTMILQRVPGFPRTTTISLQLYHDVLGTRLANDYLQFKYWGRNQNFTVFFSTDGIETFDAGAGYTEVGVNLVKSGASAEWQEWRFIIQRAADYGNWVCDIWLDDSTHDWVKVGEDIPCDTDGGDDGSIMFNLRGYTTNNIKTKIGFFGIAGEFAQML